MLDHVSVTIGMFENAETQYVVLLAKRTNLIETVRRDSTQGRFEALKTQISELDNALALLQSEAENGKAKLLILLKESAASWVRKGEA